MGSRACPLPGTKASVLCFQQSLLRAIFVTSRGAAAEETSRGEGRRELQAMLLLSNKSFISCFHVRFPRSFFSPSSAGSISGITSHRRCSPLCPSSPPHGIYPRTTRLRTTSRINACACTSNLHAPRDLSRWPPPPVGVVNTRTARGKRTAY